MSLLSTLRNIFWPPRPPKPPAKRPVDVIVHDNATLEPLANVTVRILTDYPDTWLKGVTNSDGWVRLEVSPRLENTALHLIADGYFTSYMPTVLKPGVDYTNMGTPFVFSLTPTDPPDPPDPPTPPLPNAGEYGRLIVRNESFYREDGSSFQWRGSTEFPLLHLFILGIDIEPIIRQRIAAGVNIFRVSGMYDVGIANAVGHGVFYPQQIPDYFQKLGEFADYLGRFGLRLEFTAFADAQIIMPPHSQQQEFLNRVHETLRSRWNVCVEICNEPFKNGVDVERIQVTRNNGILYATGAYDIPFGATTFYHLDYVTKHDERKQDWPRTARSLDEMRNGFDWKQGEVFVSHFEGTHCPVVGDEPMGCADVYRDGSRSNIPSEFGQYAGIAGLMVQAATFHSDSGVAGKLWTVVQRACAEAFFSSLLWVPYTAQFAPYQRGGAGGGPGIGNMPMEHHDLDETVEPRASRTFCKLVSGDGEYCVASQPSDAWTPVGRDGWVPVNEPRPVRGAVRLIR